MGSTPPDGRFTVGALGLGEERLSLVVVPDREKPLIFEAESSGKGTFAGSRLMISPLILSLHRAVRSPLCSHGARRRAEAGEDDPGVADAEPK